MMEDQFSLAYESRRKPGVWFFASGRRMQRRDVIEFFQNMATYCRERNDYRVVLDLEMVGRLTRTAAQALVDPDELCRSKGGQLILCRPQADVVYELQLADLAYRLRRPTPDQLSMQSEHT